MTASVIPAADVERRPSPRADALTPLPPWLDRTAYPFNPQRFETPDGVMSYVDEGTGPAVLLVHGTPTWSFEWRGVIARLRGTHRVIAPDHLGFGLSGDGHPGTLDVPDHARRLRALVEALELRDLTLVVHDFGGPIGLPLAVEPSSCVSRLVVVNTWMWPSDGDRTIARLDRVVRSPIGRVLYLRAGLSARVLLPAAHGNRRGLTRAIRAQYLAPLATPTRREGTYAFARALRGADAHYAALWEARAALRRLPLTIVWGDSDPVLTAVHRERWVRAFPEARLLRLADTGHFVADERPAALAAAIAGTDEASTAR